MLAFCHIPKAAGTTVKHVLRGYYGMKHYDIPCDRGRYKFVSEEEIKALLQRKPQIVSIASHNLTPSLNVASNVADIQWVTFFREPINRYISHFQYYKNQYKKEYNFDKWLNFKAHHNTQVKMIAGEEDLDKAKSIISQKVALIGLTESYLKSMYMLAQLCKQPFDSTDSNIHKNTARSRIHEKIIDSDLDHYRDQLLEVNSLDIELYEFARNVLFPRQIKKYCAENISEATDTTSLFVHNLCCKKNHIFGYLLRNLYDRPLRNVLGQRLGINSWKL